MIVNVGGVSVDLMEEGDRICAHLKAGERWEAESLAAWAGLCAGGGQVIDAGAYTGLYAIAAAKLGCTAFAFEPMPENVLRCRANAMANGVRINVLQAALTNGPGRVCLRFNPRVVFTSGASLSATTGQRMWVDGTTIDALDLDDVAAIKIDVERAEHLVLAGAAETLKRCKPALLVEALDAKARAEVIAAAPGYAVERVLDGRNLLMRPC